MTVSPELSRVVKLDELGNAPRMVRVVAVDEERDALARRFGLVQLERLEGEVELRREGEIIHAAGRVRGAATQSCVATGDPLRAIVDAPFALRFAPGANDSDEVELSEGDCDTINYDGPAIDIGEAIAEEFALALDPFPRAPDAGERLRAAGVIDESEAGPFAGLKALRDRLN